MQAQVRYLGREGGRGGKYAASRMRKERREGGRENSPAVAGVGGAHHVLGVELLLRQLRHRQSAVLLGAAGSLERRKEGREGGREGGADYELRTEGGREGGREGRDVPRGRSRS